MISASDATFTDSVSSMDNGPEFISHELTQWVDKQDTVEAFIPPGM
nr:hypothetical protein [Gleimia europaea]